MGWIALSAISRLQILRDLRHFWLLLSFMGVWSILIVPLPIRRSIPSSFLMIFLLHLQSTLSVALASVALPEFEPLDDRRMEWSPLHPSTDGATSWVPQWVCRSCGASTSLLDIPLLDAASCSVCSTAIVFDRPSGRAVRFCVPCQRVVSHDSSVANPVASSPPSSVDPPDWFSHGPLS